MAHLIKKSALVAEIERRVKSLHQVNSPREQAVLYECKDILHFIDTLEVTEVDLEKAIDDYIYTHDGRKRLALELDWKCCNLTLKGGDEIIKFAKHFFELGIKVAQKG